MVTSLVSVYDLSLICNLYTLVVLFQRYQMSNSIICSEKFLIIVILMYPVPSLTHMLDILGNF